MFSPHMHKHVLQETISTVNLHKLMIAYHTGAIYSKGKKSTHTALTLGWVQLTWIRTHTFVPQPQQLLVIFTYICQKPVLHCLCYAFCGKEKMREVWFLFVLQKQQDTWKGTFNWGAISVYLLRAKNFSVLTVSVVTDWLKSLFNSLSYILNLDRKKVYEIHNIGVDWYSLFRSDTDTDY